jgi:hypothetical protein
VRFLLPEAFLAFLDEKPRPPLRRNKPCAAYKVKVRYQPVGETKKTACTQAIVQTIAQAIKRLKKS